MDVLNDAEISELTGKSALVAKYEKVVDSDSAYEMLVRRMEQAAAETPANQKARPVKEEQGIFEQILQSKAGRTFTGTLVREGVKAVFGMLGLGRKR